jgi:superfamily II DNA or RNA helicase
MGGVSPPFVAVEHIRGRSGAGSYARGSDYFQAGAVRSLVWDAGEAVLRSTVDGSASHPYRCVIRLDPRRPDRPIVSASCTCPVQSDCKHAVATLLESNRRTQREAVPASGSWRALLAAPAPASTRTKLALGVELRQRVRRSASGWSPLRAETATPRELAKSGHGVLVGLRPLERSARTDAWIKGDATWDSVRRPSHGYDSAQVRWLVELHSIGRDMTVFGGLSDVSEWLTLDDIASGLLWPHLAGAAGLGIPIVATKKTQDVLVARDASAAVRIERSSEGLRLSPAVRIDGELRDAASVRPVGRSGAYSFAVRRERVVLVLAPVALTDPVHALLMAAEPVTVPPDDEEEFLAQQLVRIVRQTPVEAAGVELPEPARPTLVLTVRFEPGHRIAFDLAWSYDGGAPQPYHGDGPDRDRAAEEAVRSAVEDRWALSTPIPFASRGTLSGLDAAAFAVDTLPALEVLDGVKVVCRGARPDYRELSGDPHVTITTVETADPDWFDLGVVVTIDGRTIPFPTLFTALAKGRSKVLLADGGYFSLAHPSLQRLRDLIQEAAELREWETGARISRYQAALWADFEDLADESLSAVSWRAAAEGLRALERVEPTPIPSALHAELRPYQREGFEWLAFLWRHRLGGVLADDMGLGKTLQLLALIAHTREAGERRPFLVVAPTSVTSTWRSEAARFTPDLRVEVVGATASRGRSTATDAAASADIVVTTYTILRLEAQAFASIEWAGVVLDEAQFVKNAQTALHRAVKELRADVTYAVTGTPLENGLTELWAILSLAAPGLFPSARRFREEYVQPIEKGKVPENQDGTAFRAARLARLRRRIRPLLLRRTKELVARDLPPKQEQEVRVELSPAHRAVYDTMLQRERQKVLGLLDDLDRNRFIVFRSLTLLRMLALAPGLVDAEYARIVPSKLDALLEHLEEVVAEGHRVLVFSQFTSFLDLVEERLDAHAIAHVRLDGSTRHRGEVVSSFREGDAPVFLISLKAGGFGLTLTEADYVFLLDPWWNPAAESQAVDRTHRIGQSRTVMVYRLIAAGTIEEKVLALQQRKARLFGAVMDDDALFGSALTAEDIRGLFET